MSNETNNLEFIKNEVDVDVDGLRGINHYRISAMYNRIHVDEKGFEWADLTFKVIDEFDLTWDEIEKDGGIAQVNRDLKECYGV